MKRPARLIILNLVGLISYLLVSYVSGSARHVYGEVFSRPDSLEYRAVADWIYGARGSSAALAWRPFLYPLLLGLAERVGGLLGIWFLNVGLWFFTLNVAAAATYRFVKSHWAAAVVFALLATNMSLILLTFEGLTEITAVTLLVVWAYGLTHLTLTPTASQIAWSVLPLSLLVVVKPEFEYMLAAFVVVLAVVIARSRGRALPAVVLVACLAPIAIQLALNVHFNGYFGISNIGEKTLRGYFLARLDVAVGQSPNIDAARLKLIDLSNVDAAHLVLNHPGDAVGVFISTLFENLLAGSNFVIHGHPTLARVIVAIQVTYFVMLLASIPLIGAALLRARDGRLALVCAALLNIYFAGGLTFSQGDRITIIALPLWLVAVALAVNERKGRLQSAPRGSEAPPQAVAPPTRRVLS